VSSVGRCATAVSPADLRYMERGTRHTRVMWSCNSGDSHHGVSVVEHGYLVHGPVSASVGETEGFPLVASDCRQLRAKLGPGTRVHIARPPGVLDVESSHARVEDALRPSVLRSRALTSVVVANIAHGARQHILRILRANPNRQNFFYAVRRAPWSRGRGVPYARMPMPASRSPGAGSDGSSSAIIQASRRIHMAR